MGLAVLPLTIEYLGQWTTKAILNTSGHWTNMPMVLFYR